MNKYVNKYRLQYWHWIKISMGKTIPVADPGEGTGGPTPPPPFLDQSEARRSEKNFFGDQAPAFQRVWMTPPTPLSQGPDPAVYPVFEDPSNGSNTRREGREPDIKALYYLALAKTITAALKKTDICLSRLIVLWSF